VRARSLVKQARKPGKRETDRRPRTNPRIGTGIQRRPAADDRPNHPWIQYHPEPRQPPVDVCRQECSKQPRHLSERWPATRQRRLPAKASSEVCQVPGVRSTRSSDLPSQRKTLTEPGGGRSARLPKQGASGRQFGCEVALQISQPATEGRCEPVEPDDASRQGRTAKEEARAASRKRRRRRRGGGGA